jgi:endonuclease/exonuclease/phosphatase family metal-dependent hydrolase
LSVVVGGALAGGWGADAAINPPLKVMSFNIRYGTASDGENHWSKRHYLVRETIKVFAPDLLGLQEVVQLQVDFLRQEFPHYSFHGVGREDGKRKGEYVPVMYRTERFDCLDAGHFWLSETPEVAGSKSWDSSLPRMVSWVRLRDRRASGPDFVFANAHFDHRGRQARLESARLIRQRLESTMPGKPVILTGDFNTNEDQLPYQALVGAASDSKLTLMDTDRVIHPHRSSEEATFSSWRGTRKGSRIDWILHTPDFVTLNATINRTNDAGRYPSDHYPVEAILRLKHSP